MPLQFREQYIAHSDAIYKYIFYLTGQKELAEDLTQETFYKAFLQRHSYRQEAALRTWLRTIARNLVYDYTRRQKIYQFIPFIHKEQVSDTAMLPEDWLLKGEEGSAVFRALYSIKLEYREALIMRYVEEYSVKDTAQMLGWSEAKVKNNTTRGLAALKKILGREGFVYG